MAAQKKQDVVVEDGAVYVLRAGMPVYVKTADVCAATGKSNQWIGQLTSQGVINKKSTPHGSMFDMVSAMRAYCDMLEARIKEATDRGPSAAETEKLEAEVSGKKATAIIKVLQAKELQGQMHRAEDVMAATEDMIYTMRGMLLALPGRLAVDAAALTEPAEVAVLIRGEVYNLMTELSRYQYDPKKYEERVRKRLNWEQIGHEDGPDE